tara:strand:- start:383 stop:994 length:612 start_codon:yes stop_codon:yes gene_type:complete
MTSKLIVNSVRHTSASADGITMAADGSVTFPGNATCSGTATGFGGGKILQVKHANDSSSTTYASSVYGVGQYTDLGTLSINITPASTNSKILILAHVCGGQDRNDLSVAIFYRIMRDSTPIQGSITGSQFPAAFCITPMESYAQDGMYSGDLSYVDSPSTTSQVTYKVQGSCRSTIAWAYNRGYRTFGGEGKGLSNLTLLEFE